MPGIEIVYAQVKQAKTFAKIQYCLKVSKYVAEEDKINYSWHMNEKYKGKEDSIHLYYVAFPFLQ